tara:strand:+ start:4911 stop:5075 length:165 start_codon:yes stop_codon:yes gene_type:complete
MAKRKKVKHKKPAPMKRQTCPVCDRSLEIILMAGSFAGDEVICMRCWTDRKKSS